ncbi:hypothetical protein M8J76_005375 [Diaphorina citri]|nr:hypothetical protein M8J76_005375 [Diaphorina citri]
MRQDDYDPVNMSLDDIIRYKQQAGLRGQISIIGDETNLIANNSTTGNNNTMEVDEDDRLSVMMNSIENNLAQDNHEDEEERLSVSNPFLIEDDNDDNEGETLEEMRRKYKQRNGTQSCGSIPDKSNNLQNGITKTSNNLPNGIATNGTVGPDLRERPSGPCFRDRGRPWRGPYRGRSQSVGPRSDFRECPKRSRSPGPEGPHFRSRSPGPNFNFRSQSPGPNINFRSQSPGPNINFRSRSSNYGFRSKSPGPNTIFRSQSPGPNNNFRSQSPGPNSNLRSQSPGPGRPDFRNSFRAQSTAPDNFLSRPPWLDRSKSPGPEDNSGPYSFRFRSQSPSNNRRSRSPGLNNNFRSQSPGPKINFGSRSPGPNNNFRSRSPPNYGFRSKSPGPINNFRSQSPGPNFNFRSRSPGPNNNFRSRSNYGFRSKSPGPNTNFRSQSPGPNSNFRSRSKSPGPNNNFRSQSPGPNFNFRSKSPGPGFDFRSRSPGPNINFRSNSPGPDFNFRSKSPGPGGPFFRSRSPGPRTDFRGPHGLQNHFRDDRSRSPYPGGRSKSPAPHNGFRAGPPGPLEGNRYQSGPQGRSSFARETNFRSQSPTRNFRDGNFRASGRNIRPFIRNGAFSAGRGGIFHRLTPGIGENSQTTAGSIENSQTAVGQNGILAIESAAARSSKEECGSDDDVVVLSEENVGQFNERTRANGDSNTGTFGININGVKFHEIRLDPKVSAIINAMQSARHRAAKNLPPTEEFKSLPMKLFIGIVIASACLVASLSADFIGGRFLDPPVPAKCPGRLIHERIDGRGYYYSWRDPAKKNEDEDWLGARNFCRHMCMDLVSLQTKPKNEYFKNKLVSENVKYIWTSGRLCNFKGCDRPDLKPTEINGWFWSAESLKLAPTTDRVNNDWSHTGGIGKPQPDNREPVQQNGGQEECLALLNNKYNDGVHWHDVACHHRKPFICEDSESLIKYVQYKNPELNL